MDIRERHSGECNEGTIYISIYIRAVSLSFWGSLRSMVLRSYIRFGVIVHMTTLVSRPQVNGPIQWARGSCTLHPPPRAPGQHSNFCGARRLRTSVC